MVTHEEDIAHHARRVLHLLLGGLVERDETVAHPALADLDLETDGEPAPEAAAEAA